jgi:tetratricopeptide (TPR) repeat protein
VKNKVKYIIIIVLSFIVYGNTLFHDYVLDDAIVITENKYTLNGFAGIKDILSEDSFSGFFEQKGKKLVAGGRYRPFSLVSFAIEWELIMGSPFKDVDYSSIKRKLDNGANPKFILPSNKLLKDLCRTIHTENRNLRNQRQNAILESISILHPKERSTIKSNLDNMQKSRKRLLFVSHFINVLLYALTCLILLLVLQNVFPKKDESAWYLNIPFIAVLIFLVHPVHTEVVANIKGRDEILSLLGSLSAMFFVFKYLEKRKVIYLLVIFLSFLVGLFSKEVAVTFLVIIPLAMYFFGDTKNKKRSSLVISIPLIVSTAIYFYVRHRVVGYIGFESSQELMNNSFLGMTFSERYATIFYTLLMYLKLLIFPHPLTFDYYPYHIAIMNWGDILPVISLVIYAFLGTYALFGLRKKSLISFGILFYLITLSPTSNILFPIGVFMNERFIYASSIGIIIVISFFISTKLPLYIKEQKVVMYALIVLLSLYSVKTISRNRAWENDFTLFTTDVKTSVNSAKSNTSAGGKLIEEAIKPENKLKRIKYLKKSIVYLSRAIKIHPKYKDAYLLMGNAQWELYSSLDSMFKYYDKLLQINPTNTRVFTNIFETNVNTVFNDYKKAKSNINILHRLEKYNSSNYYVNYNLGKIYGRFLNDLSSSKKYLEKAAKINPNNLVVFKDLGVAYGMSKEYEKSATSLIKAIELDKSDLVLKLNLAMTYANLKDYKNALKWMDDIYNTPTDKNDTKILIGLANMYRNFGNEPKANKCLIKAQNLNPELLKND